MQLKEIQELIRLINKTDISEFKLKDGEFSISIRSKNFTEAIVNNQPTNVVSVPASQPVQQVQAAAPAQSEAPAAADSASGGTEKPAAEAPAASNTIIVKSPMVGTFYRKPGPDKDLFCKVGDTVSEGDKLCIIEAMKLFNEIESEVSGKIVKILVDDASPVEYDQPLFEIDPNA